MFSMWLCNKDQWDLASELISPRIQINLTKEANKVAWDFAASTALGYNATDKQTYTLRPK
jgi:hypothetical protein